MKYLKIAVICLLPLIMNAQEPSLSIDGSASVYNIFEDDFEDVILAPFTTSGQSNWSVLNGYGTNSGFGAVSGALNPGDSSNLQLVIDVPTGQSATLSFQMNAQTTYTDEIYIKIDGVLEQTSYGTVMGWANYTFNLSEGNHLIEWQYVPNVNTGFTYYVAIDDVFVESLDDPAVRIADGTEGSGKILVSDTYGNAHWTKPDKVIQNPNNVPLIVKGHEYGGVLQVENTFMQGTAMTLKSQGIGLYLDNINGIGLHVNKPEGLGLWVQNPQSTGLYINSGLANGINLVNSGTNGIRVWYPLNGAGIYTEGGNHSAHFKDAVSEAIFIEDPEHGILIDGAIDRGIIINDAGGNALTLNNSGSNGLVISQTGFYGAYVGYSANDGIYVIGAGGDGIEIANSNLHGLSISSSTDHGVNIASSGSNGIYINNSSASDIKVVNNQGRSVDVDMSGGSSTGAEIGYYVKAGGFGIFSENANHGITANNSTTHNFQSGNAGSIGYFATSSTLHDFRSSNAGSDGLYVGGAGRRAATLLNAAASSDPAVFIAHGNDAIPDLHLDGHARVTTDGSFIIDLDLNNNSAGDKFEIKRSAVQGGNYAFNVYENGDANVRRDLDVLGTLSKGGGAFKIDHPLDPENKYLYHSFVESPDMMNVYNGNIILDENGNGTVTLPDYFESLNRDFRYQLTCIGGAALVFIDEEISNGQFKIAGGLPSLKVSWQVTGIRQDPFANANRIPNEVDKEEFNKGKYLHPEAYRKPAEQSLISPKLVEDHSSARALKKELAQELSNVEVPVDLK